MHKEKGFLIIKWLLLGGVFGFSFYGVFLYVASDYTGFLQDLFQKIRRMNDYDAYQRNPAVLVVYKVLKYVLVFALIAFAGGLYDCLFLHKSRFSARVDRWIHSCVSVISGNIRFARSLDIFTRRGLALIFIGQTSALLFFLLYIPFHYDEAWTYIYFSSRGLLQTATFYPLPNNHIFYNLVAVLFCRLPFSVEVCTRLPSLFSNLIATWYFFKLGTRYFPRAVVLLMTILFAAGYPVILYSVEARGYAFLVCFTVLLFYAADGLVAGGGVPHGKRLRFLFFFCVVAGLYTMPSFLFAVFVINMTLFIYYAINRRWKEERQFLLGNLIAGGIVLFLYAPVLYFNGHEVLTNPNGSSVTTLHEIRRLIFPHLAATWSFLWGTRAIPPALILALILPASPGLARISASKGESGPGSLFFVRFSLVVLFSPAFILFLYPVIPFERTWVWLVGPLFFSVGFFISFLAGIVQQFFGRVVRRSGPGVRAGSHVRSGLRVEQRILSGGALFFGAMAGLLILLYANFKNMHHKQYAIDYAIQGQFARMGHSIDRVSRIGYTGRSLEYYVAEDLFFQCYKRNVLKPVTMEGPKRVDEFDYTQNVLIVSPDSALHMKLDRYEFIGSFEDTYSLFMQKEIR